MSILHNIIFYFIKKGQTVYVPDNPPDYVQKRLSEEKGVPQGLPSGIHSKKVMLDGISGEHLYSEINKSGKHVLYIHGGGFVSGSTKTVRPLTGRLAKELGMDIYSIHYRLAPENSFPAAPQDCYRAYCALEKKFGGNNIILMGESAGGTLALASVLRAKDEKIALPACVVAMAPAVQFDRTFPSYHDNLATDCMVSNLCREVQDIYFQTTDEAVLHDPYGAPYYGDFSGFPPVMLIASDSEVLRDDSVCLQKKIQAAGSICELHLFHKMMHIFPVIPSLPESRRAYRLISTFVEKYT
ncbi:MAG: alpha/beta hydrolase [Lachnospiraceae bacterium]|nr:alpha/beta hydrolase [Lachnospiraceae bacterium]